MWETVASFYGREDAIQDGVLVDVTKTAREAGFKFPVAVTQALWNNYIIPHSTMNGQSEQERLWDVLYVAAQYAKYSKDDSMFFGIDFLMGTVIEQVDLKLLIFLGDRREPVITIMLQQED
ncbi:DUF6573 family protein [Sporomusa sphaeroides]|uniref:Uncharacterized protein n=1 Tax=Sporomusa sphaeroides DSM 2875 TaxID=1337886 RepID=A0A1U7M9Y2_9FIRM|nr:DUF6573 family protein [Sporomusa sphaeroides]OLS54334.1 hypothetical protein SPSPH_45800 [Sporomusa sphaeroides DSM 2875]CVK21563.1 hypothetical protein SSPH_04255 [Sporomusa sphaeroides DSM 2875]